MKMAIAYYSKHYKNTKKLLEAIAASADVTLIDVMADRAVVFSRYVRIGFASSI